MRDLRRRSRRRPACRCGSSPERGERRGDPLQRDADGRLARRGRARRPQSGSATAIDTVKLKLGAGDDDVATVEAVREAVGPDVKIRVDANEAWDATPCDGRAEPDRAVRDRAGGAAGERAAGDGACRRRHRDPAGRRRGGRVRGGRPPGRPAAVVPLCDGEALEGRRRRAPRARSRGSSPPTSRARSTAPSGIAAAAHTRAGPPRRRHRPGHRPRPRHSAPVRRDDRHRASASSATASSTCPTAQASASSSTRTALSTPPGIAFGADGPDQSQHRARLGTRRGARALRRRAGGDLPGVALDARRAGAPARAGDRDDERRRRALGRVLRAGRGARLAVGPSRSPAPREPRRRTSTPPSPRRTRRRCR